VKRFHVQMEMPPRFLTPFQCIAHKKTATNQWRPNPKAALPVSDIHTHLLHHS